MKALVLRQYNCLVYEDVPDPCPGEGEVLVAVKACGICGSDVHGMDGSTGRRRPPIIMGHEAAGIIAGLGAGVTGWEEGDRVTFDSTVFCRSCTYCRRGLINLCDRRRVLGVSCAEYHQQGAFAEYLAVPAHILHPLPPNTSFVQAAVTEALAIAVHAAERAPRLLGASALIVGVGMIGSLLAQVLRVMGYGKVFVVDTAKEKLESALHLGADVALNPGETDVTAEVLRRTGGSGVDVAFEAVGTDDTVKTTIGSVRKGGSVVLIGNVKPAVDFPLQAVVTRQITLYGSCASAGEYPTALDLIADGKVKVDALISATASLADGAEWFRRLYQREPGLMKVVLCP